MAVTAKKKSPSRKRMSKRRGAVTRKRAPRKKVAVASKPKKKKVTNNKRKGKKGATAQTTHIGQKNYKHEYGQKPALLRKGMLKRLAEALGKGNTIVTSCGYAGIDDTTLYRYLEEGKIAEEGSPLFDFCGAVRVAITKAAMDQVDLIRDAGKDNWRAAAWLLSRRYPEEWADRQKIMIGGDPDSPPILHGTVSEKVLTDSELMATMKATLARAEELKKQNRKKKK